jgi:hypothetical protein
MPLNLLIQLEQYQKMCFPFIPGLNNFDKLTTISKNLIEKNVILMVYLLRFLALKYLGTTVYVRFYIIMGKMWKIILL